MCDPISIATLTAMAIGTGVKAGADIAAGIAAKDVARSNQNLANLSAANVEQRGERAAQLALVQGGKAAGEQRVGLAASGVDVGSGSALDILTETRATAGIDAQTIKNNAALEAWGLRTHGTNMVKQADQQAEADDFSAASTILTGATQVGTGAFRAYQQNKKGS